MRLQPFQLPVEMTVTNPHLAVAAADATEIADTMTRRWLDDGQYDPDPNVDGMLRSWAIGRGWVPITDADVDWEPA